MTLRLPQFPPEGRLLELSLVPAADEVENRWLSIHPNMLLLLNDTEEDTCGARGGKKRKKTVS